MKLLIGISRHRYCKELNFNQAVMSSSEEEIGDPVDVSDEEVEVDNEEEEDEVVSDMSEAGEHDEDSDEVMDEEQEEDSSFIERDEDEQEVDVSSSPQVEEDRSEVEAGSSDQPEIPSEDVEVEHVETDPAEVELEPEHVEHGEDQGPSASTTLADAPTVEVSPVELSIIEKWKEVRHELDESRPRVFGDSQRENLGKKIFQNFLPYFAIFMFLINSSS